MPKNTNMNGLVLPEISSCLNEFFFPTIAKRLLIRVFSLILHSSPSNIKHCEMTWFTLRLLTLLYLFHLGRFPANLAKSNETDSAMM